MRYLLCGINAKYIHSNLAIFDLQAYARNHWNDAKQLSSLPMDQQPEILIREYTINHYVENILQDLYEVSADVIIFSCYIWNIMFVKELASELKKISPACSIWLGGPEVSYDARQFLEQNPAVDLIMQGEGEDVFYELTKAYDGRMESIPSLAGIAVRRQSNDGRYRNRSETDRTETAIRTSDLIEDNGFAPLMDMNEIPFVYDDFQLFEHKILYYETSRGCPFHCSYCLSSIDKTVRFRSLEKVKSELDRFLAAKVPQVKFVDRTFNCDRKRAKEIWKYVTDHDNGVTNFHFEISSDLLDDESLSLFAKMRPGLIQLEIGLQSTNPPTIDAIRRHMDIPELFRRVDEVHALGNIHQHLDLIAGLPYENYEQFGRSFNDLYVHQPDQLQLGFLKVLKGTQMMLESIDHEICYRDNPPYEVLSTRWLSYSDLIALKGVEELVELYYNSGQYIHTLRYVVPFFESPFTFYESFSRYFRGNGFHRLNHNRLQKYEILRRFLKMQDLDLPLLDEIMIYDLYLRENVKGRPAWAPDQTPYKKTWKEIYRSGRKWIFPDVPEETYDSKKAANHSHLERFSFDICAYTREKSYLEGDYICLFDYQERNPLNQEARTICFLQSEVIKTAKEEL